MSSPARSSATIAEFLEIPEGARFHELIGGEIIEKASPSGEHGDAQAGIVSAIRPRFQRRSGSGGPGGWWILSEVEVLLGGEIVRPDVVGWRRERCAARPTGKLIELRPDWICEVLSETNANTDTIKKLRLYHRAEIPHYWIVDPRDATLTAMRWANAGYITVMRAERGETVRAEPFEAIEIIVGTLFGEDPPDE